MPSFQRHIFVCVNERTPDNPRGCCLSRGALAVRARFKRELAEHGLRGEVRANAAGCLDQCEHGVTVVVYPEQVWYGRVTEDDVAEIVQKHIIKGEYLTRLMLPDQPHLHGSSRGEPVHEDPAEDSPETPSGDTNAGTP